MDSIRAKFVTEVDDSPHYSEFKNTCRLSKSVPTSSHYMLRYYSDTQIQANPLSLTLGKIHTLI